MTAQGSTAGIGMTMGPDPYASTYAENTGGSFSFSVPSQYTLTQYTLSGSAFDGWCSLGGVGTNCEHYGEGQVIIAPTGLATTRRTSTSSARTAQAVSLSVGGLDATGLTVSVGCNGGAYSNPCPTSIDGGPEASVTISSAAFWLTSDASPTGSGFSGSLLDAGAHGTADIAFTAADPNGPGVYNVKVLIDGKQLYSGTPNTNGGAVRVAGQRRRRADLRVVSAVPAERGGRSPDRHDRPGRWPARPEGGCERRGGQHGDGPRSDDHDREPDDRQLAAPDAGVLGDRGACVRVRAR
jgi:hypothetical protein